MRYTAVQGGLTYVLDRQVSYTFPNSYYTDAYTVTIPAGNAATVKFYFGGDTAPGSSDSGYGIMLTAPVRSVISLNQSSGILVGYREVAGGKAFDGATSQGYSNPYATVRSGGDIGFTVNAANHDAGLMVQWNFGTQPGTYPATLQTFTTAQGTGLSAAFRESSITAGGSTLLDLSVTNSSLSTVNGLGYTFTLPSGLVIAEAPPAPSPSNGCGGTLTANYGTGTITYSGGSVGRCGQLRRVRAGHLGHGRHLPDHLRLGDGPEQPQQRGGSSSLVVNPAPTPPHPHHRLRHHQPHPLPSRHRPPIPDR